MPIEPSNGRARGFTLADDPFVKGRAALDAALVNDIDPALAGRLTTGLPAAGAVEVGAGVLRDLLSIEVRPDRFDRLVKVWAAKVGDAVERGDFASAGAWVQAAAAATPGRTEFSAAIGDALAALATETFLGTLLGAITEADHDDGADVLLGALGRWAAPYLIDQMAVDEPVVHRRHLVEYLSWVARADVRLVTPYVADRRWFVVRNVAIALGRAGRATAVTALAGVTTHRDERVRVEALRALAALDREATIDKVAASLDDRSGRVRHAALSLLRANPSEEVIAALAGALEAGRLDGADAKRVVAAIAERPSMRAAEALEGLAARKFAVRAGRAARDAARQALRRREAR